MHWTYDAILEVAYVELSDALSVTQEEVLPGVILDRGVDGAVVGMELIGTGVMLTDVPDEFSLADAQKAFLLQALLAMGRMPKGDAGLGTGSANARELVNVTA
jgi:uncharacterized protein YuzE